MERNLNTAEKEEDSATLQQDETWHPHNTMIIKSQADIKNYVIPTIFDAPEADRANVMRKRWTMKTMHLM